MNVWQWIGLVVAVWLAFDVALIVGARNLSRSRPRLLAPAHADDLAGRVDGCASWRLVPSHSAA